MNAKVTGAIGVVVLLLLVGCGSASPATRDFLLRDPMPAERTTGGPSVALPLRVRLLSARSFLAPKEIAWRQGDVLSGTYRYQRWAEPPAEMVTRRLAKALRERAVFVEVDEGDARAADGLTLSGTLVGMHEVTDERGRAPAGVVEVELVLERPPSRDGREPARTMLHAKRTVAATDESIDALVRALSDATAEVVAELAGAVEARAQELAAAPAGAPPQ